MTPDNREEQVRALRELRDMGDVSDWRAMEAALSAAILALERQGAGAGLVKKWRKIATSGYPPLNSADKHTAGTLQLCASDLESALGANDGR